MSTSSPVQLLSVTNVISQQLAELGYNDVEFTSEIGVELVDSFGDDLAIARSARVSTGKKPTDETSDSISGLIRYLMRSRHGSPFEHGAITVYIHAPIFVFREWHRHRIGWSYNEESARYKELSPVFYIPPRNRPMVRADGFKSSSPNFVTLLEGAQGDKDYESILLAMKESYRYSYVSYKQLLNMALDRGLARDVLPVGIYSSMYATANPRSLMHFLELRTSKSDAKRPSKPLYEIEVAAKKLEVLFAQKWPLTYSAWNEFGRMAP